MYYTLILCFFCVIPMKKRVKDDLTRFLYAKTKRKPMVLPVIMTV